MLNPVYSTAEIQSCVVLDESIKKNQDRVADLLHKRAYDAKNFDYFDLLELKLKKGILQKNEDDFVKLKCRDKIEYERLKSTAQISTDFAVKQEQDVLVKNKNEQLIYILLGSIVFLTGIYILIKKND